MFKTKDYGELPMMLQEHFSKNHEYEGDGFAIVLCNEYGQNIYSRNVNLKSFGFKETMTVPVSINSKKTQGITEFETSKLVPFYHKGKKTHVYILSSLHSRNNIFGYVVMKDVMQHVEDRSLYSYMSRLGESFEKYRKIMRLDDVNAKLQELSIKDSLTGLFNRLGYDSIVSERFKEDCNHKIRDVILFMDINRLKFINDTYGHLQGDMAIRTIASVISECIPKDWMAVRYGGDVFLVIGSVTAETDVDYLSERICSTVEKRGEELMLPYKLSASSGFLITDPASNETLEDYIETADKYMYENKKRSYKNSKESSLR